MAITKALMYSRVSSTSSTGTGLYKKMRVGATRLNYFGPKILLSVNGTNRHANFDRATWKVAQQRRGQPTQLSIDCFGFTPAVGQTIILGAGALTNRLFRGTITAVAEAHDKQTQGRTVYSCTCLDWAFVADGERMVTAKFSNLGADAIALALFTLYAPAGFTARHIQGGLTVIDEIQFTAASLNDAFQQLCDRFGGYFYWDFEKDLHLFATETTGVAAEALTSSNKHVRAFKSKSDIEDLRNRIYVEGSGSTVAVAQVAGATTLPLDDVSMFDTGGGQAKMEAQLLTYAGVSALTTGSAVAGLPQSPSAPTAAAVAGQSGDVLGTFQYKVVHRLPTGDSEASAASAGVTVSAVSAPGSAPTVGINASTDAGVTPGARKFMVTYVTAKGETLAGTRTSNKTIAAVTLPSTVGMSITPSTGGSVPVSSSFYTGLSYVTDAGETEVSFFGIVSTGGAQNRLLWASIPLGPDGRTRKRKLWRSKSTGGGLSTMQLVGTINDNTTTSFTDDLADASLGALGSTASAANTTGGQYDLTAIPTSGDGRVTARKIYRTVAGGSIYKLLTTISDNVTTTFTDTTPDSSLGNVEPATDTSGGGVVTVTVPIGSAAVTARRIFRTENGGSTYKYLGAINDNVTTTFSDTKADATLGDLAPTGSTVRTEALSTTLRVQDLAQFPAQGWVKVDSQVLFYTGRSGSSGEGTLTGIATSGVGFIQAPIAAGASVVNQAHLTGIPASGTGALAYNVTIGDTVNLLVQVDDAGSQATYGIRKYFAQDRRLSIAGATVRANAELALRKSARTTGSFDSSDPKLRAGGPLSINNWGVTATVVIDSVTFQSRTERPQPMASAQFASRSVEDLYAAIREIKDRLNR